MITRVFGISPFRKSKISGLVGSYQTDQLNIMCSYYYLPKQKYFKNALGELAEKVDNGSLKIWVDSGAFSAFRKGIEIDIDAYMRWLNINRDYVHKYISMDYIADEKKTKNGYDYMRLNGFTPIPVFHRFDSLDLLDYYVSTGADIIALGSRAPFENNEQRFEWLDKIFARYPSQKFHCLGFIGGVIVDTYNFSSCDSCTWEIKGVY